MNYRLQTSPAPKETQDLHLSVMFAGGNVGNDMKADGYNALAKDVDINVGGDMSLSERRDFGKTLISLDYYNTHRLEVLVKFPLHFS